VTHGSWVTWVMGQELSGSLGSWVTLSDPFPALVGLSHSEPCKTAEPIEMPFGLRTRVVPGNHVLNGGPDPPMGSDNFLGGTSVPL